MEIATPKETVQNLTVIIRPKRTLYGVLLGSVVGLAYSYQTQKSLYLGSFIGALTGGIAGNILIKK
jgi:uncharacterized membrane protein